MDLKNTVDSPGLSLLSITGLLDQAFEGTDYLLHFLKLPRNGALFPRETPGAPPSATEEALPSKASWNHSVFRTQGAVKVMFSYSLYFTICSMFSTINLTLLL